MSTRARLSHNTLILLASNVGSAILAFLLSVLIGRMFGDEGLGVYAAALAWVFPLTLIAEFGLGTLITREVAANPHMAAGYLRATGQIRLIFGGGLTLLLLLMAPLLSDNQAIVMGLWISSPLLLIAPIFGAYTAVFRARQIMWPIAVLNIGMLIAQVILTAAIFITGGGVLVALAVNSATSAGQLVAAWGLWRLKFSGQTAAVDDEPALHLGLWIKRAWPFALAGVLAAAQMRLSFILLEGLRDTGEVGYYAAANRFAEAGRMIPNAVFGALFPALAALSSSMVNMRRLFRRVMLGLMGYGLLLGLSFSVISTAAITLTYGDVFAPAAPVLSAGMWALLPGLLRAGATLYWYAAGREMFANRVTLISLLVQVAFSLLLIPDMGALGAVIALLITEGVALMLLLLPLLTDAARKKT